MQREYFKETSLYPVNYYIYQPIVLKIEELFKSNSITPNMITMFRLLLSIIFTTLFILKKSLITNNKFFTIIIILIIMLFCGLTDDLDGYIARKYKMQSKLGKYLDFISDFSMFCMMLYCAYFYNKSLMTQYIGGILLIWCLYRIKEGNKNSLGLYTSNILNIFKNDFVMYFCLLSVVILIS